MVHQTHIAHGKVSVVAASGRSRAGQFDSRLEIIPFQPAADKFAQIEPSAKARKQPAGCGKLVEWEHTPGLTQSRGARG